MKKLKQGANTVFCCYGCQKVMFKLCKSRFMLYSKLNGVIRAFYAADVWQRMTIELHQFSADIRIII